MKPLFTGITLANIVTVTNLVSAFRAHFPTDFRFLGEKHESWEFVFVESGRIKARADDRDYLLRTGEMVCHRPGEFHAIRPYHGEAHVIIFCFCCQSPIMSFFQKRIFSISSREKQYLSDIASLAKLFFLPKDPFSISRDGGMDINPSADSVVSQQLRNTLELLILSLLSSESTERCIRMDSYDLQVQRKTLTADVKAYLHTHLTEKIQLSDVSKHVSYSISSVKRIFKEETGESVIRYLTRLRIERAMKLLQSGVSVTDAAHETGFETVNYFSTVFKAATGKTPSAFRNQSES